MDEVCSEAKTRLLKWQEECLAEWEAHGFRGIVNAVTGSGKTVLALSAAKLLMDMEDDRPLKVKIVVPKTFLLYQWKNAITGFLNVQREDVGFFSGANKAKTTCRFMVYVVNSARYSISRHIAIDIKDGHRVLLIADECHHYGSVENSKIFEFIKAVPKDAPYYTLGLSATPFGNKHDDVIAAALGNEFYRYTFFHALNEDVVSKFTVFNISVAFNREEADEYEDLSFRLAAALSKLKSRLPALRIGSGQDFFTRLERLVNGSDPVSAGLAKNALVLFMRRKEIVHHAKYRLSCVVDLIAAMRKTDKIIAFSERIETADEVSKRLARIFPNEVGVYHSKMSKNARINVMRRFENSEIRILVSCKTLDEGLNIPEADVGIIVSSTNSRRQRIQRLGRVLRKKQNDRAARLYYLFVSGAVEEEGVLAELKESRLDESVNVINLGYDETRGAFINEHYQNVVSAALADMSRKGYSSEHTGEFLRNAELGLINGGWHISAAECLEKIKSASGKAEKNYYTAMLMLIRANE